ncbi:MAG: stage 0 sporulation family protein [Clostridiales bacterium]|nr:stage 0 sporulation family protein [Clostridiales bacterium]
MAAKANGGNNGFDKEFDAGGAFEEALDEIGPRAKKGKPRFTGKTVKVVGVRFKKAGRVYYFSPRDLPLAPGDAVIVETARGLEYGTVAAAGKEIDEGELASPLKDVLRKATAEDAVQHQANLLAEKEAFGVCREKIRQHNLPIKLTDVSYIFDSSKIVFYFTAEGRVDFRELVRDLAGVFRTRIELRQIGVRDEAKMMGGMATCGRELCCHAVFGDFHPVSIRMAKKQNLSLNPAKISGVCGRLMCCLKYEHYEDEERPCGKQKCDGKDSPAAVPAEKENG